MFTGTTSFTLHILILNFINFKTYSALLFLDICAFTHWRKVDLQAVKLAQSFLGTKVQLKFSHSKEKSVLCFLGQEGEWLGNTLQGQAHAFAAVRRQKTTNGASFSSLFLVQHKLPLLHRAPPTGTAMETVATASSSYSLSRQCHLCWVKIRMEDIKKIKGNIKGRSF